MYRCVAFYKVSKPQKIKSGPRGLISIFVGYTENSKAYGSLDLETNMIVETVHVDFI